MGVDASSPYEASYDINASGLYEVYAVASDDDERYHLHRPAD